jgi:hypothetical protein
MDTTREKLLRIRQIVNDGMLQEYEFSEEHKQEIIDYVEHNAERIRELSLRMVLKIADLRKSFPDGWQAMARTTCMRRK